MYSNRLLKKIPGWKTKKKKKKNKNKSESACKTPFRGGERKRETIGSVDINSIKLNL